jgi:serine protease AprX
MKARLVLTSIIVVSSFAFAQQLAPLGRLLEKYYPTMSENDKVPVWVYFSDKGSSAEQQLSFSPQAFISERAVQRRLRTLPADRLIDLHDIPLEPSYVQAVSGVVTKVRHEVKWFNALSVVATREQIDQLRQLPYVSEVEMVARFRRREVLEPESRQIPQPHPTQPSLIDYGQSFTQNNQINTVAVHNLGIDGSGVLIGIFDAGFSNLTHPALVTRPIVARYDFVTNSPTLGTHSHGQNTFSVIGGFAEGNLIGPAFGSSFVLARTEDATPETPIEEDNWARAIIWADSIGIDVASTSLGYSDMDPPWPGYTWQDMNGNTTVITRAADRAVQMGIVVVNSAGNGGTISEPANTLGAPADGFNVIAAGAINSSGTRSGFSSVGPSADGRIKPDVMAMGEGVRGATGATGYTNFLNGTSFSCPLSAGVAALVLSGNLSFNLTPLQVRDAMRQTASRANNPDRFYGWGILDALKAVNYAWIEHTPLTDTGGDDGSNRYCHNQIACLPDRRFNAHRVRCQRQLHRKCFINSNTESQ